MDPQAIDNGNTSFSRKYLDNLDSFEQKLDATEGHLSTFALKPYAGRLGGVAKSLIGVIETISGLFMSVITLASAPFVSDKPNHLRAALACASHIPNGLKNIAIGFLETLPFLGIEIASLQLRTKPGVGLLSVKASHVDKLIGQGLLIKTNVSPHILFKAYSLTIDSNLLAVNFESAEKMKETLSKEIFNCLKTATPYVDKNPPRVEVLDEETDPSISSENKLMAFSNAIAIKLCQAFEEPSNHSDKSTRTLCTQSKGNGYAYEIAGEIKRPFDKANQEFNAVLFLKVKVATFHQE